MLARIPLLFALAVATAHAQETAMVGSFALPPGGGYFGVAPFRNQPPTFVLTPKLPGARNGRVWIRNTNEGLLIVGKVDGPDPQWSTDRRDLLAKDHIEVWIAGAPDLDLPPPDWAGEELNSAADCVRATGSSTLAHDEVAECRDWYAEQMRYRPLLKRLFVRQFVFTYQGTVEEFATPAYHELTSNFFSDYVPTSLEPKLTSTPLMLSNVHAGFRWAHPNETGYEFQIFIPYDAFPPLRQLALQDLWTMVNVFSSAAPGVKEGSYAGSAPAGKWGRPTTFNHIRLDPPRRFTLSRCDVELSEDGQDGQTHAAWFFPAEQQGFVNTDFILDHYRAAFRDWGAKPSPIIHPVEHFWKELPGGAYVCGPDLSYRKRNTKSDGEEDISQTGFDVKALPDGWILVKSGPEVEQPHDLGQCGSCPFARLRIWSIDPQGQIDDALDIDEQVSGAPASADISLSRDWRQATLFLATGDDPQTLKWSATTFCLQDHSYPSCGKQENAKPPDPPNLPGLREH